jgi:hypothetical protein
MDPVLGGARDLERPIDTATPSTDPAVGHLPAHSVRDGLRRVSRDDEALPSERIDEGRDAARSVLGQIHGEHVAQFDAAQDSGVVRVETIARRSDNGEIAQRWATILVLRERRPV